MIIYPGKNKIGHALFNFGSKILLPRIWSNAPCDTPRTSIKKKQKKVVFADGEDANMLKAAIEFGKNKLGTPIVIGNEKRVKETLNKIGLDENFKIEIVN